MCTEALAADFYSTTKRAAMSFIGFLSPLVATLARISSGIILVVLMTKSAAAETVALTFEQANGGPTFGIEYGSLAPQGFPAFVRDGFEIDVAHTGGIDGLHFHETDSIVNPKVPDRPIAQRGVLWFDAVPNEV